MAPNRKKISLVTESLVDLQLVHAKASVPPQQQLENFSASYWEWASSDEEPAEPAPSSATAVVVDLFSADHIQSNLIQASLTMSKDAVVSSSPSSDDYWAEHEDQATPAVASSEPALPQHAPGNLEVSDRYWDEADSHNRLDTDRYWDDSVVMDKQDSVIIAAPAAQRAESE